MVMHGMESTVPVPLDLMIMHGRAVVRGTKQALIVVDMPFGTYEESPQIAFRNAARIMKETNCGAVKLKRGPHGRNDPFLGRTRHSCHGAHRPNPQSTNTLGGFKTQGRDEDTWPIHQADAKAVAEAGAFSIVLEGMVEPLAAQISKEIEIPTIGIGASAECDGQILVLEDMLGLNPNPPKFVKQYGNLLQGIEDAVEGYAKDVKSRAFPTKDQTYQIKNRNFGRPL